VAVALGAVVAVTAAVVRWLCERSVCEASQAVSDGRDGMETTLRARGPLPLETRTCASLAMGDYDLPAADTRAMTGSNREPCHAGVTLPLLAQLQRRYGSSSWRRDG